MLFEKITEDMKTAMKEKDSMRLAATRSLFSAIKNEGINSGERNNISDEICIKVIKKQVKQRKDSIEQFKQGKRDDLVAQEQGELEILETYLPEMLSEEDIKKTVLETKKELGVTAKSDMGKLMGAVMKKLSGQEVDGTMVRDIVNKNLQ